jgi:energy-coupling factor transporter ATP-binding protein EcfA2
MTAEAERGDGVRSAGAGLVIRGLGVRYHGRDTDALTDLDLGVGPGELVGVAGRNGAGKSTLVLAAGGLVPRIIRARVRGSITVDGEPVLGTDPSRRRHRVGVVFSSPHNQISATKFTVREELAFGLENIGLPRAEMEARIERVMADLGIAHLAERYPFHLSGGEQQRVAIASVLVMGSDVLVLDEPTAQLDPAATTTVADLLEQEVGRGIAVLVAEHSVRVLLRTARCLLLEAGRAVAEAEPAIALGSANLRPLGLSSPTIVVLAELAGIADRGAFDEAAVAAALAGRERAAVGQVGEAAAAGRPRPAVDWEPVRDHPPTAVEIAGLVHRYPGGIEAVRGVTLGIPPGQRVAIVGQNGSGKTTLVKHLNGLLRPDAGEVRIGGASVGGRPVFELARTVGFVFQDPDDQLFNRTVERELRFGPANLRLPAATIDRLVEAALEATGLAPQRLANPYDLGLSERKLVALASVLAMDPAVLVLDEPTTGQDGPGVARIGAIVDAVAAAGRTVVAITHDMEFAAEHFERIVVMRAGEVVLDGSPAEVFAPERAPVLASTGLEPPVAARIGARLGLGTTPTLAALLAALDGAAAGGDRAPVPGRTDATAGSPPPAEATVPGGTTPSAGPFGPPSGRSSPASGPSARDAS